MTTIRSFQSLGNNADASLFVALHSVQQSFHGGDDVHKDGTAASHNAFLNGGAGSVQSVLDAELLLLHLGLGSSAHLDDSHAAAVEEGVVAGGGTIFVNIIPAVEALLDSVDGDEKTGVRIIAKALEAPIRQIAANAGLDGSVILEKVRNSGKLGYGFDAYKEEYCDMVAAGIIDPAKVTRSALENAASVSAMVLTTESLVADKPEPPAPAAPADPGMGGMY